MARRKINRKMISSKKSAFNRGKKESLQNSTITNNKHSRKKLSFTSHINPIVASIIVVYIIIIIVYFFQSNNQQTVEESLSNDKQVILNELSGQKTVSASEIFPNTGFVFISGNNLDIEKLRDFAGKNYSDIKKELNIQNDFCIHFEDENGNVIDISNITGRDGIGLGSSRLKFNIINSAGENTGSTNC